MAPIHVYDASQRAELLRRLAIARDAGQLYEALLVDPGLGVSSEALSEAAARLAGVFDDARREAARLMGVDLGAASHGPLVGALNRAVAPVVAQAWRQAREGTQALDAQRLGVLVARLAGRIEPIDAPLHDEWPPPALARELALAQAVAGVYPWLARADAQPARRLLLGAQPLERAADAVREAIARHGADAVRLVVDEGSPELEAIAERSCLVTLGRSAAAIAEGAYWRIGAQINAARQADASAREALVERADSAPYGLLCAEIFEGLGRVVETLYAGASTDPLRPGVAGEAAEARDAAG